MSKDKTNVKLVVSTRMNSGSSSEDAYIRIPSRARKFIKSKADTITMSYGKRTVVLTIKNCFKEDLLEMKRSVASGGLTKNAARCVGYVTTNTLFKLIGEKEKYGYCGLSNAIEDITIGADPEFVVVDPKTLSFKYAENIPGFPRSGTLGSDGPLAEVRPPPSNNIEGIIKNIRSILSKGSKGSLSPYAWLAGATYKNPTKRNERCLHIGGHIHLGDPLILPQNNKEIAYRQIIRMLDELMAIPLVKIDGPNAFLRRNTVHTNGYGKYGLWGDTRPQVGRFEWRVPSGLWMAHPDFARAVLGTAKAITETSYQMMADKGFNQEWVSASATASTGFLKDWLAMGSKRAANIVNKSDPKLVTAALIRRSEGKLTNMPNYEKYKDNIDEFMALVKLSKRDRMNLNLNIKDTWLNGGKLIMENA